MKPKATKRPKKNASKATRSRSQSARTASAVAASNEGTTVLLEIDAPQASLVCLAGSFNDWHPTDFPLSRSANGRWSKELMLPPGRYEYLFVVDGQWRQDPNAGEHSPNPYGGTNCVLNIRL